MKQSFLCFLALAGATLALTVAIAGYTEKRPVQIHQEQKQSEEISVILSTSTLEEREVLYKRLIEKIGPRDAQEQLYRSGLSFDGESHLLNHVVGDWLYQKYGPDGLALCRDYFLSSCYHGFVIAAVAVGGQDALAGVMQRCWQHGPTVAVQCAHAIGHGFLAWGGYKNFIAALTACDDLATKSANFPLYNCHDGAFMENVWAVHEDGKPSPDRWLSQTDPVYPCNDPRIEYKYINACWSNQPSRMYMMFGGDFGRIGRQCLKVDDQTHQRTCFDGLARQIHPLQ